MRYLSFFHPKLPVYLTYMFQQVEYNPHKFLKWIIRFPNVTKVMHRQTIVWTIKARALAALLSFFWVFYLAIAAFYIYIDPLFGIITLLFVPLLLTVLSYLLVMLAWLYVEEPRRKRVLKRGAKLFEEHQGVKIAISGSYGKTSMKELLNTVLNEGLNVAATPGNRNVPISHASWIDGLRGKEDVLLIEFGEGGPGDIKKLATLTHPEIAIITGLAPNHLDEYKDLDDVAKDLLSIGTFVQPQNVYINSDCAAFDTYDTKPYRSYSAQQVLGWKISKITVSYEGTSFTMQHGKKTIVVRSGLLGRHQVGPLALVAALADQLGLAPSQIEAGLAKTVPFEHRMQARKQHGAWIIDDTYNGSLEGLRAGLALLTELPAKRKVYVTPGLVDQGVETERVHLEIGGLIAAATPDRVVLMQNSATQYIVKGLEAAEYKGDLQIEADPLTYYTNLEHVVAGGDLFVLQNDWTDNYV